MKANKKWLIIYCLITLISVKLYAAVINHNPILEATEGKLVEFRASVIDGDSTGIMNLYVKTDFSSQYIKYRMEKRGNEFIYNYNVPSDAKFLYYYIEYTNKTTVSSGTYGEPNIVKIKKVSSDVLLLDPEGGKTYESNRILISVSLFNAMEDSINIKSIKLVLDGKVFKEIDKPDKILYVFESDRLKTGKHEIDLIVNDENIVTRLFFVNAVGRFRFSGNTSNLISYTNFFGNSTIYSNQDTTTFNGYSNSRITFTSGNNRISAGYNVMMHNHYRNIFYLDYSNSWSSISLGDYSCRYITNFLNSTSFRGFSASIGDFYLFHGSQNNIQEGSVNGTDTTFGVFREVSSGFALDNRIVKLGFLFNRDDTNSIKIGISPMENVVLNMSVIVPIKFIKLYSFNSISLTTLDYSVKDSIFDYNLLFFHLNPSTIPLAFSGLPFLSTVSGIEFNSGMSRVKLEYFRKGNGFINSLYDRENVFENGFRFYNSLFIKGFTFTGNLEFDYPENQDIKKVNLYCSKNLPIGYIFGNFVFNGSKAYYFDSLSSSRQNYYYSIGGNSRIAVLNPLTMIISFSRLYDNLNTGLDDALATINLYARLQEIAGIVFIPGFQLGYSWNSGVSYSFSLNSQYDFRKFTLSNTTGYYNVQNALYLIENAEISYKLHRIQPSVGIYYQNNFTPGSSYSLLRTYLKFNYAF